MSPWLKEERRRDGYTDGYAMDGGMDDSVSGQILDE